MARVHQLPKGAMGVPMPPPLQGTQGPKLPGGLPPVAYRSANARFGNASRSARSDGTSKAARMECLFSTALWEHDATRRRGGHWVPAE